MRGSIVGSCKGRLRYRDIGQDGNGGLPMHRGDTRSVQSSQGSKRQTEIIALMVILDDAQAIERADLFLGQTYNYNRLVGVACDLAKVTGARWNEVSRFSEWTVDWVEKTAYFLTAKNNTIRTVFLGSLQPATVEVLSANKYYLDKVSYSQVVHCLQSRVSGYYVHLEGKNLWFHLFRHAYARERRGTFPTLLAQAQAMGLTNVSTLNVYLNTPIQAEFLL